MAGATPIGGSRRAGRRRRLARLAVGLAFAAAGRADRRSTRVVAGVLAIVADRMLAPRRPDGLGRRRAVLAGVVVVAVVAVAAALAIRRRRTAREGSAPAR